MSNEQWATSNPSVLNSSIPQFLNSSIPQRLGVLMSRWLFFWAFRYASGFPLYLCSLHFSPLPNPRSPIPNPRPRIPFPVPLAKDAAAIPNATGYEQWAASFEQKCSQLIAHSSQLIFRFQLSIFNSKSPERTTEYRQAVECIARNPCFVNQTDIKVPKVRQRLNFCRTFGTLIYFKTFLCRHSALRASSPAYCLSLLTELFELKIEKLKVESLWFRVQSS